MIPSERAKRIFEGSIIKMPFGPFVEAGVKLLTQIGLRIWAIFSEIKRNDWALLWNFSGVFLAIMAALLTPSKGLNYRLSMSHTDELCLLTNEKQNTIMIPKIPIFNQRASKEAFTIRIEVIIPTKKQQQTPNMNVVLVSIRIFNSPSFIKVSKDDYSKFSKHRISRLIEYFDASKSSSHRISRISEYWPKFDVDVYNHFGAPNQSTHRMFWLIEIVKWPNISNLRKLTEIRCGCL